MPNLDLRSVILLVGVMGILMSVVIFFLRRSLPPSIEGLGEWAGAPALIFLSSALLATRGVIPDFFSVVLANLLLLSGCLLLLVGGQRFFGVATKKSLAVWLVILGVAVIAITWYTMVEPNYGARLRVTTALMFGIFISMARLTYSHGATAFSRRFATVVLLVQSTVVCMRFIATLVWPSGDGLFEDFPFNTAYVASFAFTMLLLTVAIVLLANDRMRVEFQNIIAERELAEESLRASDERWQFAVEGSGDGVWDWNLQTGAATFSRRWKEMLGFSEFEIANHSDEWVKRVYPEDMPGVMAKIGEHLEGKTATATVEFRMLAKDGSLKWILGRGMVVSRDVDGKPLRLVGTNTDITERMRTEIALRESENRLSAVFQASPIAIVVSRIADGKIVDGNDAAMRLYGIARNEAIGRTVAELGTYVNLAQREEMLKRLREHGSIERFPLDFRRKGGEVGALEVSGRVVELNGEPSLVTMLVDVTERNRVDEELKKTLAFADSMSEAMPLPVFHKDASGRYTGCNSAFARFIGKTRDEIVGKTVYEVSPQQFAKTYRDKDLDLLGDASGSQTYEGSVQHTDGTVHDVIFHKARLTDSGGKPTGIVGVITDITDLKRIHAKQLSLEAQLRESQKMEALGTLAGGVAHDFNNIVAAISGNTELARRDVGADHPALESLEEIRKAGSRAKELVQQILAFGRRQGLARKVISLAPVVEESARLLRATMLGPVTLNVECIPGTPAIFGDPTQIQQVLLNLCNNAWHAVERQGRVGLIEIRVDAAVRSGAPVATLTVRDNGHGMDEATQRRIFEPFFTTKPVGKGTGLGLAVVHSILKDHEACMEVVSAPGQGTTFAIHFPAAPASDRVVPSQTLNAAPIHGNGKRVLYVDDDEAIVFLVTRLLERQGYRVSGYTDPKEALATVRAEPGAFDLAVTDFSMPGMSGLDVAIALKDIRPDLPIAVASGYITDELRQKAPAAGVSELIYKPNTVEDLCEAVARLAQAVQQQS